MKDSSGADSITDDGVCGWIDQIQRDKPVRRYAFAGGFFLSHIDYVPIQGQKEIRPKASFGLVGLLYQTSTQDNFMKESLGKVLGLLVVIAFTPQIAIDGLPILVEQKADQSTISLFVCLGLLDKGPMCRQEDPSCSPYTCLVITSHAAIPAREDQPRISRRIVIARPPMTVMHPDCNRVRTTGTAYPEDLNGNKSQENEQAVNQQTGNIYDSSEVSEKYFSDFTQYGEFLLNLKIETTLHARTSNESVRQALILPGP